LLVEMGELVTIATLVVRAEEAWEPVMFGGLIPAVGAGAVGYIIYRAVRANDETEELQPPPKADEAAPGSPPPSPPESTT
jgi:hypothetical protein